MGEDEKAMEYDTDKIFRHLYAFAHSSSLLEVFTIFSHPSCFYLDSSANAERHGMDVKSKYKNQIVQTCVYSPDTVIELCY